MNEERKIELEVAATLKLPDINLLNRNVHFSYDERYKERLTDKYVQSFLCKLRSLQYFIDLIELFNEIKFSHIKTLANYRFSRELNNKKKDEYSWQMKYYFENSIYRYYSYWELIGCFFNSFFDLRLELDKKNHNKEGKFFFARDVYPMIQAKYYHKYLAQLFEVYESSQKIFDYRIKKTHKNNPTIEGTNFDEVVRYIMENEDKYELRIRENYSIDSIKQLSEQIYQNILDTLEILGNFFEVGHDEIELLGKGNLYDSRIIIPNKKCNKNKGKV